VLACAAARLCGAWADRGRIFGLKASAASRRELHGATLRHPAGVTIAFAGGYLSMAR